VIGAGGLGSPIALYLASAGVGTLTLCDDEAVDLTNLQRQIVHRTETVGRKKVDSARATLGAINPEVKVVGLAERVDQARIETLARDHDVVIDGSDNFATRHAVNRACVKLRKPLVSGAAVRFDGQVAVFDLRAADSPCYACLFPEGGESEDVRCAVMGVFAPLTGIVGSIQAAEALKLLAGAGETLAGRLLLLDALAMQVRTIKLARDPGCAVCAAR
jgi:molybdopterin-synthase adenylyltransferase